MDSEPSAISLHQRILATWQRAFPELSDPVDDPGTSILSDPQTPPKAWVSLWPVGQRVVVYRYNFENLGSAGIACSLALGPLA